MFIAFFTLNFIAFTNPILSSVMNGTISSTARPFILNTLKCLLDNAKKFLPAGTVIVPDIFISLLKISNKTLQIYYP